MKNIFDYATKELSQDAFICWLVENYDDEKMGDYAYDFINFLSGINLKKGDIKRLTTIRQYNDMDVIIDIWTSDDFKKKSDYVIIMENKTESSAHSDQLKKYGEKIDTWENKTKIKIFYKSNFLSDKDMHELELANNSSINKWNEYDIEKIYSFFKNYENVRNCSEIFESYVSFIIKKYKDLNYNDKPFENNEFRWFSYFKIIKNNVLFKNYPSWISSTPYGYCYIGLRVEPYPNSGDPYFTLRSRDCSNNEFIARIETYDLNEKYDCPKIRRAIKDAIKEVGALFYVGKSEKKDKQVGRTEKMNGIQTNEMFVEMVDKCLKEYKLIMEKVKEIMQKK